MYFFFFFQAEDGIRAHCVTGVQTCALPISATKVSYSPVAVMLIPSIEEELAGICSQKVPVT